MGMQDVDVERHFLEAYAEYVAGILEPTSNEAKALFSQWKNVDYWSKGSTMSRTPDPTPIQRIHQRVKRPESVKDKVLRKPESFSKGLVPQSFIHMTDTIGVRIIVHFLSQFSLIDAEIQHNDALEISEEHPPIAYLGEDLTKRFGLEHLRREDKESGYASVHYVLRLKKSTIPEDQRPWFELQLRTVTEDAWCEVEHVLAYKTNKRTSLAVRRQFQLISQHLKIIDDHFQFLHDELERFQTENTINDTDPLNAENLPAVLAEVGIGCGQREIDGLLKILASRNIRDVFSLHNLANSRHQQIIRDTYSAEEKRPPTNFEVVSGLASLVGYKTNSEAVERVKLQIAINKTWREIQPQGRY